MAQNFVIVQEPAVLWPVTVRIPADGGMAESRFKACIRVYAEREYAKLMPPPHEGDRAAEEVLAENAEYLPRFITGWEGVSDKDGCVPISRLPEILQGPYGIPLSAGLWRAVSEVRLGIDPQGGATEKNFAPPPAPGPEPEAARN